MCGWVVVTVTLKLLACCGLRSTSPSSCWAVGCFPGRDWAAVAPGRAAGACCGGGGSLAARCSWKAQAEVGPGVVCIALGKGELGGMLGRGEGRHC